MLLSFFPFKSQGLIFCSLFLFLFPLSHFLHFLFLFSLCLASGLAFDEIFSLPSSVHEEISPNTYTCPNDAWPLAQSINCAIEFSRIPYFYYYYQFQLDSLPVVTLCRDSLSVLGHCHSHWRIYRCLMTFYSVNGKTNGFANLHMHCILFIFLYTFVTVLAGHFCWIANMNIAALPLLLLLATIMTHEPFSVTGVLLSISFET